MEVPKSRTTQLKDLRGFFAFEDECLIFEFNKFRPAAHALHFGAFAKWFELHLHLNSFVKISIISLTHFTVSG